MQVFAAVPILSVSNLDHSVRYYVDVLQFTVDYRYGDYAGLHLGDGRIRLTCLSKNDVGNFRDGSVYFICDETDVYFDEIRARGAIVAKAVCASSDGSSEFAVHDLDGNELTFVAESTADKQPSSKRQH